MSCVFSTDDSRSILGRFFFSPSPPLPTNGSYWDQIKEKGGGAIIKMSGSHPYCLNFTSISNSTDYSPFVQKQKCRNQKVRYCGQQSVDGKPSTSENGPTILCETSGERYARSRVLRNKHSSNLYSSFYGGRVRVFNPPSVRVRYIVHRSGNVESTLNRG